LSAVGVWERQSAEAKRGEKRSADLGVDTTFEGRDVVAAEERFRLQREVREGRMERMSAGVLRLATGKDAI